jgi:osmotically-inducible protein OsmY
MKSTKYGSVFFILWISAAQAADYAVTEPEKGAGTSPENNQSLGEYVDDAMITAKAKAALWDDAGLSLFDISVDT